MKDDAAIIAEIEKICFPSGYWDESSVLASISRTDAVYGIETDGGEAVGYFIGTAGGGEAELLRIAVLPDHRGKGKGKRLLEMFLDRCRECADKIFLEVGENNTAAVKLYQKYGFKMLRVRKNYYRDENALAMVYVKT